jgi:hypothetical protein
MKHLIIVAVVTATVSTTDSFQLRYAEGGAARDQSRSRHVALSRGTPIPAVIVPNDDFVIVERDQTGTTVTLAPVINDRDEDLGQRVRTLLL